MANKNDIIARLLLETAGFEVNLGRAKKSVSTFEMGFKSIMGTVGKFAAGLGVATTAVGAFDKIIHSTDATGDQFDNMVAGMKASVDQFFLALDTGDFSLFEDGLKRIMDKAAAAASAFRDLTDATTAYSYFSTKNAAAITEAMTTIRDPKASRSEKEAAVTTARGVLAGMKEDVTQLAATTWDYVNKALTQTVAISAQDTDPELFEKILHLPLQSDYKEKLAFYSDTYKAWLKEYNDLGNKYGHSQTIGGGVAGPQSVWVRSTEEQAALDQARANLLLNDSYREAVVAEAMWNRSSEETVKGLQQQATAVFNAQQAIANYEKSINRAANGKSLSGGAGAGSGGASKILQLIPDALSLNDLKNNLSYWQQEFGKAATDSARRYAAHMIEVTDAAITRMRQGATSKLEAIDPSGLTGKVTTGSAGGLKGESPIITQVQEGTDCMQDYAESAESAAAAIGSLSTMVGAMSGLVDDSTQAWITWGAKLLATVASSIPALVSLTTAHTAAAAAESASSAAVVPVAGPAMAVAAIASIVAAMAAIPKFEAGGLVGGTSYAGDRILARVNSGELILNRSQQASLAAQLDRRTDVTVKGVIRGKDLQLVLDRYADYRRA